MSEGRGYQMWPHVSRNDRFSAIVVYLKSWKLRGWGIKLALCYDDPSRSYLAKLDNETRSSWNWGWRHLGWQAEGVGVTRIDLKSDRAISRAQTLGTRFHGSRMLATQCMKNEVKSKSEQVVVHRGKYLEERPRPHNLRGWRKWTLLSIDSCGHDDLKKCYPKSFQRTIEAGFQLGEAAPCSVKNSGVWSARQRTSNKAGSSGRARWKTESQSKRINGIRSHPGLACGRTENRDWL